jgi:hypothetical protein
MGLAASQARFLGITARKSNIEYEGQQVNQQRTALAEEVNALYSKLLSLDLPTAPDTTEYYETNYSFSISNTDNSNGDYIIKSYYANDDGTYFLNTTRTYNKTVAESETLAASSITKSDDGNYVLQTTGATYTLTANAQNSANMVSLINSTFYSDENDPNRLPDDTQLYYYQDSTGLTHYMLPSQVENYNANSSLYSYTSGQKSVTENVIFEKASITFDENNRMSGITGAQDAEGNQIDFKSDIDATRTYNTEGYDAALRDYTMSKDEYDKAVADLNSQTESLQQEDKVLELRLNQIDTEQSELQTELDAVKAVLDKNIENTFNTFS